jgi:enolase
MDSPLLTPEIRTYLRTFKVEESISVAVNRLVRELPPDANAFFAGYFGQMSAQPPNIRLVEAQTVVLDTKPSLRVRVHCEQLGQPQRGPAFVFSPDVEDGSYLYDEGDSKTMNAAALRARELGRELDGLAVIDQGKVDRTLLRNCENEATKAPHGSNTVVSLSKACAVAAAAFVRQELSEYVVRLMVKDHSAMPQRPRLFVPLFYTGKSFGFKSKFSRFSIFESASRRLDPAAVLPAMRKIHDTLRRVLAAGRLGEAGVKYSGDDAFIAAADTLNECFRLAEDCVNQAGFRLGEDFLLAIDCNADNYFLPDTKKYEAEGVKVPPDAVQLAEYYLKLGNDRPYIGMLEDPYAASDFAGLAGFISRSASSNLKVGTIRLARTLSDLRDLVEPPSVEDQAPVRPEIRPNLVVLHHNSTVTELVEYAKYAHQQGIGFLLRESTFESLDVSVVDLAFGLRAEFLQLSFPVKSARIEKYNRLYELSSRV